MSRAPSTPGKYFADPNWQEMPCRQVPMSPAPVELNFASPCHRLYSASPRPSWRADSGPTPPPVGCRMIGGYSPVRECVMPLGNAPINVNLAAAVPCRPPHAFPVHPPSPCHRLDFVSPPPPRGLSQAPSSTYRWDSEDRDSDGLASTVPALPTPVPEILCEVWRDYSPSGRRLAPGGDWEFGFAMNPGTRNYMEDTCATDERAPHGGVLLGVFDGHRGSAAADYAAMHMSRLFAERMLVNGELGQALTEALLVADLELFANRRRVQTRNSPEMQAGTTATVCAALPCGRLAVGWVGDSRAILCEQGRAVPLTRDHRLSDSWPEERRRVENAGASTAFDRVEDELAVTRALGDFSYKRGMGRGEPSMNAVSNHAQVTFACVTDETPFVLIASDGLWDVMPEDLVVEWCLRYFQREPYRPVDPLEDALVTPRGGHPGPNAYLRTMMQDLCTEAVKTYRSQDNVTSAILLLKPLETLVRLAPPRQPQPVSIGSPAPEMHLPPSLQPRRQLCTTPPPRN
eukprot:Hpha_TRINITY_DN16345_c0_g3::TRINITY_DN16345_c0_g3_i1::g.59866::m.59866/K14803/PTC2_3; protein phosphatase PTC2/3